jgi:hypothetical protein
MCSFFMIGTHAAFEGAKRRRGLRVAHPSVTLQLLFPKGLLCAL